MTNRIVKSPKHYVSFVHNFTRDMTTDEIYLPWVDDQESTSASGDHAITTPYDMTLLNMGIRPRALAGSDFDLTITLAQVDSGITNTAGNESVVATATVAPGNGTTSWEVSTEEHVHKNVARSEWSSLPTISAGKLGVLRMQADADPGASNPWYITSIWEIDLNSSI